MKTNLMKRLFHRIYIRDKKEIVSHLKYNFWKFPCDIPLCSRYILQSSQFHEHNYIC